MHTLYRCTPCSNIRIQCIIRIVRAYAYIRIRTVTLHSMVATICSMQHMHRRKHMTRLRINESMNILLSVLGVFITFDSFFLSKERSLHIYVYPEEQLRLNVIIGVTRHVILSVTYQYYFSKLSIRSTVYA